MMTFKFLTWTTEWMIMLLNVKENIGGDSRETVIKY